MEEPIENFENISLSFHEVEEKVDAFLQNFPLEEHKIHDALYGFEDSLLTEIIALLNACKLPKHYASYKDFLREKLIKHLALEPNDLIIFVEGGIYIKLFFKLETNEEESAERRACGIEPETLEAYKHQFFPNDEYKQNIFGLLHCVIEETLSFRKITPAHFKRIFIPTLVNTVEIVVISQTPLEDLKTIRGFTFYLLRELFDDLMLHIAQDILFHFSNGDKKAIEFLSAFSVHETIDSNGKRHKPNPILDESNHAWNITTIRSTMLQHKKAKQALYDKKNALITMKKKLETLKLDQKEILQEFNVLQNVTQTIEEKILQIHRTITKLEESNAEEVTFSENGVETVIPRNVLIAKLFKKEDSFLSEKTKTRKNSEETQMRLSNKNKEIEMWEKRYAEAKAFVETSEKNTHPLDKQYERIQRALAKTLASR
ncbi:MAG: hypothetical protein JW802_04815 [Campylobacterales bacterium]|nr:hypothetical protein [Campylobacterales bacterium]MBN2832225.1 hypothetical protein [Campylobacterales bacterium]